MWHAGTTGGFLMRYFASALAVAAMLAGAAPAAVAQGGVDDQTVVATVNGEDILYSDVTAAISRLPDQYRQIPVDVIFPQVIERIINIRLMAERGRKQGLQDDAEVKSQVRDFEQIAIQQAYLKRAVAKQVTEEAVLEVYRSTAGDEEGPEEVRASHILVETEQTARDIIVMLDKGGDFAALAREHSTGPTRPRGGDLGYFTHDAMVGPFADAAFAMDVGAFSKDPVKTQFGWHVIMVVDKRKRPRPGFEEERGRIEDLLTREFITAHMAEIRADAEIEIIGLPGSPAGGGAR